MIDMALRLSPLESEGGTGNEWWRIPRWGAMMGLSCVAERG